jgi:serine/threonine protein kinase
MLSTTMQRTFGGYEVLQKLGEGGMAEVWLAERHGEEGFRQRVALKHIHPRYGNDPVLVERFATEARTNARLSHSNIVRVIDFGTEPIPYMALEYVEGISLNQLMYRMYQLSQSVDVAAAMFIAVAAAQALDYAHKLRDADGTPLGIVHRDVSPANVLVSVDGTPYVMDFGLVQVADNLLEAHGALPVGTYCYMAPEQLAGGHVDARADLYSLGVVLWEMLTSRRLIPENEPHAVHRFHAAAKIARPSELVADVPPDLDELTMQCLRLDPDARPPSAEAVSVALQRMLHERAPGYGREQLAKTVTWAFPERQWLREPPNLPAPQPASSDRARLAMKKARESLAPELAKAQAAKQEKARERATNVKVIVTIVALAGLLVLTSVVSFTLGVLWASG